jgi:nuclear factor of activated T-cells 5
MDIFDADSAKAPHYVLSQLTTDNKGNSKAGNGLVSTFFKVLSPLCKTKK